MRADRLVEHVAQDTKIKAKVVKKVLECVADIATSALKQRQKFHFPGLVVMTDWTGYLST